MEETKKQSLQEQIRLDLYKSMKSRDSDRTSLLKVIIGDFQRVSKDVDDNKATSILRSLCENAKEMNNQYEIDVISEYLPKMMNDDELKSLVKETMDNNNISSMKEIGLLMKNLKSLEISNTIDFKKISGFAKEILV